MVHPDEGQGVKIDNSLAQIIDLLSKEQRTRILLQGYALKWLKQGWHLDSVRRYFKELQFRKLKSIDVLIQTLNITDSELYLVGSINFMLFWQNWPLQNKSQTARQKIELLCQIIRVPLELASEMIPTQNLLRRFSATLAPHHSFWHDLAKTVQLAYPAPNTLSQDKLGQKLHNLRYVISLQQAEYVRHNFASPMRSDREKLLIYLITQHINYSSDESDRLHQKKANFGYGEFPDGYANGNYKIVIDFHSEFILNSFGQFQNELTMMNDNTVNGIVNGASFNYANANDITHQRLDVLIQSVDPKWRRDLLEINHFRAPQLSQNQFSFTSRKSLYQINGRSSRANSRYLKRKFQWCFTWMKCQERLRQIFEYLRYIMVLNK
ncbi:DUF3114 domain-containing protein [Weissella diestrammenae]|uniref:DUF3114 domain-containing protein n=1 Tax=Weissella diestrammenae TaxID=1162633 RepID=A0A7G9T5A4_9LACO|nr:DUF3114 domain-containing protein [Weissella diestrammenae]MCM0583137.1 DUF3114 domain-containing protein [Weissella diestrammenae]QNN75279.1 DUF3114 domain-containing protein [Weissella diestrammenae]